MTRALMWSLPLLIVSTPGLAQQAAPEPTPAVQTAPAPAAQTAAVAAPAAKPKKICRRTVTTGRRIAQNTCYTAEQWADYDRAQNEAAKKMMTDVTAAGGKSDLKLSTSGGLGTGPVFGLGQ